MIYRRLDIICIVGWCLNTDLLSPIAAHRHTNTGVHVLWLTSRMSSIDLTIDATRCLCLLKFNLRQFGHQYPCRLYSHISIILPSLISPSSAAYFLLALHCAQLKSYYDVTCITFLFCIFTYL